MSEALLRTHLLRTLGDHIMVAETWCSKRGRLNGFHTMEMDGRRLVVTDELDAVTCKFCQRAWLKANPQ